MIPFRRPAEFRELVDTAGSLRSADELRLPRPFTDLEDLGAPFATGIAPFGAYWAKLDQTTPARRRSKPPATDFARRAVRSSSRPLLDRHAPRPGN